MIAASSRLTVISGCASGIGAAVRTRLESMGDRVIGVDIKDAEIIADLASAAGREAAIAEVTEQGVGRLDQLVLCAGLGPQATPPSRIVAVNYFGAVDLLDGLFPLLEHGEDPSVVVISSNSAQILPLDEHPLVNAMLDGDAAQACAIADAEDNPVLAYMGSKNALGKAVRRRAVSWGKAGIRLNAVAPGPVRTPLLQAGLDDPRIGDAIRAFQVPLGRFGEPEEVAALMVFLLGPDAAWIHGSIIYIDGGSDAVVRPDRY